MRKKEDETTEIVYNIYFGLNDADTGKQEVSIGETSDYIRNTIESYGYGYTEYRTYGAYVEKDVVKGNDTFIYMLIYVEEDDVKKNCGAGRYAFKFFYYSL